MPHFSLKERQLSLFPNLSPASQISTKQKLRSGAFVDNMRLPIHRWFRYSAGFSAEWVEEIISSQPNTSLRVLDPFAGSGTTLLAAEHMGAYAVGFETHPFVLRVAKTKLSWNIDINDFQYVVSSLVKDARAKEKRIDFPQSKLLNKCYSEETLIQLEALKQVYLTKFSDDSAVNEHLWLLITSILRECSMVGTAQWQYILPKKKKALVKHPYFAIVEKSKIMANDIMYAQSEFSNTASILEMDARCPDLDLDKQEKFDLVITSPPYPNNYDYADATRLEMTFWGEIASWGDLQGAVRKYLIRSCSQHSAAERLKLNNLLEEEAVKPIRSELSPICEQLAKVRETKGGKKTYHTMVAAYFVDLGRVWQSLRALIRPEGKACFVIGDSAPYGVYVPSDIWIGELALAAGFKSYHFEKIRDRNVKWKNRKHRVPLKEGVLWVQG